MSWEEESCGLRSLFLAKEERKRSFSHTHTQTGQRKTRISLSLVNELYSLTWW
jgi:hypothetical protein